MSARLFFHRGYQQCTLADIGREVGMHKASLYYYVESKADLLQKLILHSSTALREGAQQVAANADLPPTERLEMLVRGHCRTLIDDREVFGILIEQRRFLDPQALDGLHEHERRYVDAVDAILKELEAGGQTPAADPGLRLRMTLDMLNGVVRWWRPGMDPEAVIDHVWERIAGSLRLDGTAT